MDHDKSAGFANAHRTGSTGGKITVPIMLIHAENDTIFPKKYVENIFNRLTCKKKYLLLKDTEHLVMTNNVDDVVPPIADWLKEIMK